MDHRNTKFTQNPYKVPESYFEEQEKQWIETFAQAKTQSSVRSIKSRSMIAASIAVLLTASIGWFLNGANATSGEAYLTDDDSLEYLLDEQDFGNLAIESEIEITELELNDIKLEYLEAYLDETFDFNDLLIIDN